MLKKTFSSRTQPARTTNSLFKFIPSAHQSICDMFEARIDVILYRLNFIRALFQGQIFVKKKFVYCMRPMDTKNQKNKFFSFYHLKSIFIKYLYFIS